MLDVSGHRNQRRQQLTELATSTANDRSRTAVSPCGWRR